VFVLLLGFVSKPEIGGAVGEEVFSEVLSFNAI
jgi:hypothetical protein